jgi:hypothetical protein
MTYSAAHLPDANLTCISMRLSKMSLTMSTLDRLGVSTRDDTLAVVITSISQKVSIGDAYQMQLTKESSLNEGKNTSHIVSYLQDFRKVCS